MEKTTPKINLCPCESSLIHAHGHDAATNTLELQFKSKGAGGKRYQYANVTPEMYAELCGAESIGKFFGGRIKGQEIHPFVLIEERKEEESA